ncbi:MAG: hypothetical protein BGO05_07280 [Rhizobiales bacterium 63-7]|nr:hypothetical protein [Hyphomicrobiales bacterium]OJU68504.1 MAG: hypothetical protein BGO05_07280 [Rhizobiales bacterium 63-7]
MTKNASAADTGEPNTASIEFRIKPGVAWINGGAVGNAKTVSLTSAEAAYDLALGRISPASKPEPAEWKRSGAPDG